MTSAKENCTESGHSSWSGDEQSPCLEARTPGPIHTQPSGSFRPNRGGPAFPEDTAGQGWSVAAGFVVALLVQAPSICVIGGIACERSRRIRVAATVASTLFGACGALLLLSEATEVLGRFLLTLCVAILCTVEVSRFAKGSRPYIALAPVGAWLAMGAYVVWMTAEPSDFSPVWMMVGQPGIVRDVQWMLVGGILAFSVGLNIPSRVVSPTVGVARNLVGGILAPFETAGLRSLRLLAYAGVAIFVLMLATTGYGYLSNRASTPALSLLTNVSVVYYLALYAINAHAAKAGRATVPLLLFDLLALAYELTSGSKGRFALFVLFPLGLTYLCFHRRPSRRFLLATAVFVAASVLLVFPLLVEYRGEIASSGEHGQPDATQISHAANHWNEGYGDKLEMLVRGAGTAEQVTALSSIMHFDVRYPSETLWQRLTLFWFPRLLWVDKPTPLDANEIGRASGRVNPNDYRTSVMATGLGELYVYFGIWGCLLMVIPGAIFATVELAFRPLAAGRPLRLAAGILLLRSFSGIATGGFESTITGTLVTVLAILAFVAAVNIFVALNLAPVPRRSASLRP